MNASDILLHEIGQTCRQLLDALQQEFDALGIRDYQALPGIAQNKQLLVERLNALDDQLRSKLDVQQHPRWPALRDMLQLCKQNNARNGQLLARSYQLSRDTLNILTGQARQNNTVYDRHGLQQNNPAALGDVTA